MPDNPQPPTSARDAALAAVPADRREAVLWRASDLGIGRADDVIWSIVAAVVDAHAAASAAGNAATTVEKETAAIPELIYRGTIKAGEDLRGQITAASDTVGKKFLDAARAQSITLQAGLTGAITEAAERGGAALDKAIADLDCAALSQRDANIEEWRAAAAVAIRNEVRAGLAGRMAKSWGLVAGSLLFAAVLGAAAALSVSSRLQGRVGDGLPAGWHFVRSGAWNEIYIDGPVRTVAGCSPGDVCLATRAR